MKKIAINGTLCLAFFSMSPITQATPWGVNPKTDRIIVKHKKSENDTTLPLMVRTQIDNQRTRRVSDKVHRRMRPVNTTSNEATVYQLDNSMDIDDVKIMAADIANDGEVEYAEPDYIMYPKLLPNDPNFNEQWNFYEPTGGINMQAAWDITTGSNDVVVAIIDTGIRDHVDLIGNITPGYDFISDANSSNDGNGRDSDPTDTGDATQAGECGGGFPPQDTPSSWHGTHVAGTIGAVGNNGIGVTGVAWHTKILPVRVLGKCGGYTSDIADGMRWSVGLPVARVPNNPNPAKVLNLSLGGTAPCTNTFQSAINDVVNAGATVVVAAGNESANASSSSPANCNNVVAVGATDRDGGMAFYSNFGSTVDVSAPGGEMSRFNATGGILSTYNTGLSNPGSDSYEYSQGTSMATPHVAGVAALMYSIDNDLSPIEVENALKSSSRPFPNVSGNDQCSTNRCGSGIVDAEAALVAVGGAPGSGGDDPGSDDSGDNDAGDEEVVSLANGIAINSLTGSQSSLSFFEIEVPVGASNLSFATSGGSGDVDLYVRFGAQPTLDRYDYRPYRNGNNESVDISFPESGTYYVMLHGFNRYSGVQLIASFDQADIGSSSSFFENSNDVSIPDNNSSGASSFINVTRSGNAGTITVSIDIRHTRRGDLTVRLLAPNGASATLASASFDSGDNIIQTYQINAATIPAQGQWQLQAIDSRRRVTGFINEWGITFE